MTGALRAVPHRRSCRAVVGTSICAIVAMACMPAAVTHAQVGQPIVRPAAATSGALPGVRARVRLVPDPADPFGNDRYVGRLARLDADSVAVVDGDRRHAWPRSRVATVEVSEGGRTRVSGARRGAMIGAVAGLAASALMASAIEENQTDELGGTGGVTVLFALAFVPVGAATGAGIGAWMGGERWRVVAGAIDDHRVPTPARRPAGLALARPR